MALFFENERSRIVCSVLAYPDKSVRISGVSKATKISKGYVSRVVRALEGEGLVKGGMVDIRNPEARALKILFNVDALITAGAIKKLKALKLKGAGLYGSWANGTNGSESDVDIWIKPSGKLSEQEIAAAQREIRNSLGTNPQLTLLSEDRLAQLKRDNQAFYRSLLYGSLQLFGESIE